MSNLLLLPPPKDPDDPFAPTERQERFRVFATQQVAVAGTLAADWCRACGQYDPYFQANSPVSAQEWRKWCCQDGFMDWFFDDMPEALRPTEPEIRILMTHFLRAMLGGLREGDPKIAAVFSQWVARFEKSAAPVGKVTPHLGTAGSDKWRSKPIG